MKTVLFLAFLFAVAQSQVLQATYSSFIQNLPMESSIKQQTLSNGISCLNEIDELLMQSIFTFQQDIQTMSREEAMKKMQQNIESIMNTKTGIKCTVAYENIVAFYKQSLRKPQIDEFNYKIAMVFQPKMLQAIGQIMENLVDQRVSALGENLATVFKLAAGIIEVPAPKTVTPLDTKKFIINSVSTFLRHFNAEESTIQGSILCAFDMVKSVAELDQLNLKGIDYYRGLDLTVAGSLERCSHVVDLRVPFRIYSAFMELPTEYILKFFAVQIARNRALTTSYVDFGAHISAGKYELAGDDFYNLFTIFLQVLA